MRLITMKVDHKFPFIVVLQLSLQICSSLATSSRNGKGLHFQLKDKQPRFVSVSESTYDHDHHTHHDHNPDPEPHLAPANISYVVFLGQTATLDCTVHDSQDESVSWMRHMEGKLELLTYDTNTYVNDERYKLVHDNGDRWRRWRLVINDTEVEDAGQYRCKVATVPPLILDIMLNITEPRVRQVDDRGTDIVEKFYNSGSMIELKCMIDHVPFPHALVSWRRGDVVLSFNTSRGGVSVKGDADSGVIVSRLYVANARPKDSGHYSCWYHNYTSDVVNVHVIEDENPAAMQHDKLPDAEVTSSSAAPHLFFATQSRGRLSSNSFSTFSAIFFIFVLLFFHDMVQHQQKSLQQQQPQQRHLHHHLQQQHQHRLYSR
ncbi:uncharacterized protein LOC143028305 isoform X2 [Oratosquilla oratoria]|uniref:uncharacterized protein LOC143028305 isoform X2 n=1 Tax=Oratosquilla oratoria TaxID=337810 RepID=UPI003F769618